jgi:ubiquinone/menaquinone biosynthesis C-methylase UbiE
MSDARFHLRVQRYGWDLASQTYEAGWVPQLVDYARGCIDRAELATGQHVADVATGPGTAAFMAAERVGPTGRVIGTDISEEMVRLASQRAQALGLGNLSFLRADMESPVLPAGELDAAVSVFGLMFAASSAAALRELARVLKPGGRVAVTVWGRRSLCGWAEIFPIVDKRVTSDVCPLFFSLGVPGALAAALTSAGFTDVREERETAILEWPDDETTADVMLRGGAVALAYKKFTPEVQAEVRRELLDSIAPHRTTTGYRIPAEFFYGSARKPAVS